MSKTALFYAVLTPFIHNDAIVKPPTWLQLDEDEAEDLFEDRVIDRNGVESPEGAAEVPTANTTLTTDDTGNKSGPGGEGSPPGKVKSPKAKVVRKKVVKAKG